MIKFRAEDGVVGIGLSAANVRALQAGQAIEVDLKTVGLPWPITLRIIAGETDKAILEQLKPMIDKETKMRVGG